MECRIPVFHFLAVTFPGEKCSVDLMHSLVPHAALPDYRFRGMHLKMSAVHVPWNAGVSAAKEPTVVGCTLGVFPYMISHDMYHILIASRLWLAGVFKSWHEASTFNNQFCVSWNLRNKENSCANIEPH